MVCILHFDVERVQIDRELMKRSCTSAAGGLMVVLMIRLIMCKIDVRMSL